MTPRHRAHRGTSLVLAIGVAILSLRLEAATLRSGFTETTLASGLASPTAMAFAPDGRIFVCQQGGQLRVIDNGVLLATPFVTLTVDSAGAADCRGSPSTRISRRITPCTVLHRYQPDDAQSGQPIHRQWQRRRRGQRTGLLDLNPLSSATNHNGGAMHFGIDGKLYIAVGENATGSNSQTLANLLGKVLRINSDGSIPTSNPFYTQATGVNRAIWALACAIPSRSRSGQAPDEC